MHLNRLARLLGVALLMSTLLACSADDSGSTACELSTDCPIPESCIENKCRLECRRDADCADGQRCDPDDFVCTGGGLGCNDRTRPCAFGQVCSVDGVCVGNLDNDTDAHAGPDPQRLDLGPTFLDSGPGPDPNDDARVRPPVDDAGPAPDRDRGVGPPPPDAGPGGDAGPVRPRGDLTYGQTCLCASDCASGFCVENKMRGARTCTERCERHADCPDIDTCLMAQVQAGGGGAECPPFDNGLEVGEVVGVCYPNETSYPCTDPLECSSGICLGLMSPVAWADPHDVCTVLCDGNEKCPAGYNCQSVPGANGQNQDLCAPSLAPQSACQTYLECGGVCPVPAGVDEATIVACAQIDAAQPGYCTCTCAHADDCPQGFGCQRAVESGDPTRPGICTPVAGLICPVEALGVPPVPLECMSYQCMGGDEENPFYSRCTTTCVDDRDCPQDYRCDAVDDGQPGPDPRVCVPH